MSCIIASAIMWWLMFNSNLGESFSTYMTFVSKYLHKSQGGGQETIGFIGHRAEDLEKLFLSQFFKKYNTVLQGGFDEPLYQPAKLGSNLQSEQVNMICYRYDYFSSALHEVAHWCIAGESRRLLPDYGYWYAPDGRTAEQQAKFERVEINPQAIEWAFSAAANIPFRVSVDNLNASKHNDSICTEHLFTKRVKERLMDYIKQGFPPRAKAFIHALHTSYNSKSLRSQFL